MRIHRKSVSALWLCAYGLLFGLAHSQKALFAVNQNTKFIAGLARAGYRDLAGDWLAGITDPFPLFSRLIEWQSRLPGFFASVHLAFLILLAAYGLTGLYLARTLPGNRDDRDRTRAVFAFVWFMAHAIYIRWVWLRVFPDGVGGQYLLGDYYQPCCFGILLLAGVAAYGGRRWVPAALCLAVAPLFHPAYVIASVVIAVAIVLLPANQQLGIGWRKRLAFLLLVLAVVIPYAIWTTHRLSPPDPALQKQAHELLASVRIPHHANPAEWPLVSTLGFVVLGAAAAWYGRRALAGQLLIVLLLVVGASALWALLVRNATFAVVAPWRVSVVAASLSRVLVLYALAQWVSGRLARRSSTARRKAVGYAAIAVTCACLFGIGGVVSDYQYKKTREYYAISRFIEENRNPGHAYVVPVEEMHIRLEAGVPVLATWKSHPTAAYEFLEWYRRVEAARRLYDAPAERMRATVLELRTRYGVTHIVAPASSGMERFKDIGRCVYSDRFYTLWELSTPPR